MTATLALHAEPQRPWWGAPMTAMVDEFADVVTRLWEAWEPDAVVLDRDNHRFADGAKVHAIHHDGKYFRVRGPLNAPRSPQGRVPICQAGGSPRGQAFAARWADTIITNALTVDKMKKFREDVRRRAWAAAVGLGTPVPEGVAEPA